jgi:hypothetical protein
MEESSRTKPEQVEVEDLLDPDAPRARENVKDVLEEAEETRGKTMSLNVVGAGLLLYHATAGLGDRKAKPRCCSTQEPATCSVANRQPEPYPPNVESRRSNHVRLTYRTEK